MRGRRACGVETAPSPASVLITLVFRDSFLVRGERVLKRCDDREEEEVDMLWPVWRDGPRLVELFRTKLL
jgi:hypothetical protein